MSAKDGFGGEVRYGAVEHLRQATGEVAVDQPGGFINKYGSPGAGVGVDKPGVFINSQPAGVEAQVVAGGVAGGDADEALRDMGSRRTALGSVDGSGPSRGDAPSPLPSPGGRGDGGWLCQPGQDEQDSAAGVNQALRRRMTETVEKSFGAGVNPGGRPAVITPAVQDRICTLLSVGFSRRQAAAYVDIDQSTISRTMQRDPEFAACVRRAEEKALLQPMLTVISEAQKNWRAAAWLIRYKGEPAVEITEEDKQKRHEERLADARRRAEETNAWFQAMRSPSSPLTLASAPPPTVEVKLTAKGKRMRETRIVTSSSSKTKSKTKSG